MVEVGRDDVWCGDLLAVLSVECFLFLLRFYQCYEATIQCFRCIKGTLEKDYAQEVYGCSLTQNCFSGSCLHSAAHEQFFLLQLPFVVCSFLETWIVRKVGCLLVCSTLHCSVDDLQFPILHASHVVL